MELHNLRRKLKINNKTPNIKSEIALLHHQKIVISKNVNKSLSKMSKKIKLYYPQTLIYPKLMENIKKIIIIKKINKLHIILKLNKMILAIAIILKIRH